MTTYFVSRHQGARDWLAAQGLTVDAVVEHMSPHEVSSADTVIGTLPIQLAAKICATGANYVHLAVDVPHGLRGHELTAAQLTELGARLDEYEVKLLRTGVFDLDPAARGK